MVWFIRGKALKGNRVVTRKTLNFMRYRTVYTALVNGLCGLCVQYNNCISIPSGTKRARKLLEITAKTLLMEK